MKKHFVLSILATLLIFASCKRDNEVQPSAPTTTDDNLGVTVTSAAALSSIVIAGKTNTPGLINGAELKARFNQPLSIFVNTDGSLLIGDAGNHAVRKISSTGNVTTVVNDSWPGYNDIAATKDGTIAVQDLEAITYYKNGKQVAQDNLWTRHNGYTGIDVDPSKTFFWATPWSDYDDVYGYDNSLVAYRSDASQNGNIQSVFFEGFYATSLSVSLSGNKFITAPHTLYEVTSGGKVIHLLPNTTFDGLTSIAANKDATKIYLADGGDIKLVTKCTGCQTHVTKLLGNVKATGVALSNSEKVLFFTSAQNHTISKINL